MTTSDVLRRLLKTQALDVISGEDLVKLLDPITQGEVSKLIYQLNGMSLFYLYTYKRQYHMIVLPFLLTKPC